MEAQKKFWIKSHQCTTLPVWQPVQQSMSCPRDVKTLWKSGEEREVPNKWKRPSAESIVLSRRQLHLPLFLSQY